MDIVESVKTTISITANCSVCKDGRVPNTTSTLSVCSLFSISFRNNQIVNKNQVRLTKEDLSGDKRLGKRRKGQSDRYKVHTEPKKKKL